MNFHFFLLSALLVSVRGGIQPWRPCSRLNSTDCVSSDFASLPSNGVGSDSGQSSTGSWSVAGNVLRESSRAKGTGSGDSCLSQLGVIQYVPNSKLSDLFQIRVKVRVNSTSGDSAGIVFGDKSGSYFRFQLNTASSCAYTAAVSFRIADTQGVAGAFSEVTKLGSQPARTGNWYELRMRILYADSTNGRLEVNLVDLTPVPGPVVAGPKVTLDNPSLTVGTKIGLWCGSSVGCEFRDYVMVQDSLRALLTGQLDCQACNLMWQDGANDWCRCCQQDCPPFDRNACVAKGLCTSLCMANDYCQAPATAVSSVASTTTSSTTGTTSTTGITASTSSSTTSSTPVVPTTPMPPTTSSTSTTTPSSSPVSGVTSTTSSAVSGVTTVDGSSPTTVVDGSSTVAGETTTTAGDGETTTAGDGETTTVGDGSTTTASNDTTDTASTSMRNADVAGVAAAALGAIAVAVI